MMPKSLLRFVSFLLFFFCPLIIAAQSSLKFHQKAILIDTHNDFLSQAVEKGYAFDADLLGKAHSDLNRTRTGGLDIQIFSVWCEKQPEPGMAYAFANREIDTMDAILARNKDKMMLVKNPSDLNKAIRSGKFGAMLGMEGGHMIEDRLEYLDHFYQRGVRYMTLTWNNSTSWASSAMDETNWNKEGKTPEGRVAGLNDFGKQVVRHMNELGMLVDLSHVGERTFWDAIQTTNKPVLVSHSCVYSLCPVFRNLKDDQIRAVGKNGGVIHLNFYSGFIDSSYFKKYDAFIARHQAEKDSMSKAGKSEFWISDFLTTTYPEEANAMRPPLSMLLDHLDHIVRLIGVDHVGLGSDFDGTDSTPLGLDGIQDFPKITEALMKRGYKKKEIKKILGGNFIRLFKANQK